MRQTYLFFSNGELNSFTSWFRDILLGVVDLALSSHFASSMILLGITSFSSLSLSESTLLDSEDNDSERLDLLQLLNIYNVIKLNTLNYLTDEFWVNCQYHPSINKTNRKHMKNQR